MTEPILPLVQAIPDSFRFHHVGYATKSLEAELAFFLGIGYVQEGEYFSDQNQGVKGCFLTGPGPQLELLENLPGAKTLTPWLNAGIKMYHLAFVVPDLKGALTWARTQRAKVTVAPVSAIAFAGRRISFVMFRNGLLVELIENGIENQRS